MSLSSCFGFSVIYLLRLSLAFCIVLLSFLTSVVANNNSSPLKKCYLKADQEVFTSPDLKTVLQNKKTKAALTFCKKLSNNTLEIVLKDNSERKIYVSSSAIDVPRTERLSFTSFGSGELSTEDTSTIKAIKTNSSPAAPPLDLNVVGLSDRKRDSQGVDENIKSNSSLVLKGRSIRVLESLGAISVRNRPYQSADYNCPVGLSGSDCNIDHNVELTLTGERKFDRDSKNWYVEATYLNNNNKLKGWVDEKQTSLKPDEAEIRSQTANRTEQAWEKITELAMSSSGNFTLDESIEGNDARAKFLMRLQGSPEDYLVSVNTITPESTKAAEKVFSTNRGLIRLNNTRAGLCGSYDYSEEGGDDSYANPATACVISKLAEVWRKNHCPKNTPCRLEFGDISHRTNLKFDGHKTHTHGECVDIRPIRKHGNGRVDYSDKSVYDQAKTEKLLKLIKSMGGSNIVFNDPVMSRKRLSIRDSTGAHDSHIHVCFKANNKTVQNQCQSYAPDEKMCPRSALLFSHPMMLNMKENLK